MKKSYRFELCTETLDAAIAAEHGGADRIELCTNLRVGGLTPSSELLAATLQHLSIPVHVLIRPRAGDFAYTPEECALMGRQIDAAKAAGAHGIAVGILLPSGRIDIPRTRELVQRARPMHVTFHRAFDEIRNYGEIGGYGEDTPADISAALAEALEDVIRVGADTLLTSGCAPNVLEGVSRLRRLQILAGARIEIMAGAGLRLTNLVEVVQRSGVTTLHGSLSRPRPAASKEEIQQALIADIREAIRLLEQESLEAAG
ncbi:MAG TPA: copper homeostasis protein CutC [Acidobacteriaceae bacterium]|nr:copper homeostasis protein CutC [Acidobacteriaceae bacterium]